jgi:acetyltransferase-like isoleucine patch superfamily enzyme
MFNVVRNVINTIIRLIKNDKNYQLSPHLSLLDLLSISFTKGIHLIRGFLFQVISFRKLHVIFMASGVKLLNRRHLKVGGTLTIGRNVTIDSLSFEGVKFGNNVNIPDGSFFRCTGVISDLGKGLVVGNNTGFGHYNFINAQGGVEIGDDVIMGSHVSILAENHNFDDFDEPIRLQGVTRKGIVIESNVWIGANVTILDGVRIHTGSVIGAGSVVTKSIPPNSVAVGSPCKVIKTRES